jgi:hypothetical protein
VEAAALVMGVRYGAIGAGAGREDPNGVLCGSASQRGREVVHSQAARQCIMKGSFASAR